VFSRQYSVADQAGVLASQTYLLGPIKSQLGAPLPHLGFPVTLRAAALGDFVLRDVSVAVANRLPGHSWLMRIVGFETRTDVLGDALQLDVDAVPFTVSVGPNFLSEWQHDLGGPVTLAHCYLLLCGDATVVSVLTVSKLVHIWILGHETCVTILRDSFR
jgi:hypothetical protein